MNSEGWRLAGEINLRGAIDLLVEIRNSHWDKGGKAESLASEKGIKEGEIFDVALANVADGEEDIDEEKHGDGADDEEPGVGKGDVLNERGGNEGTIGEGIVGRAKGLDGATVEAVVVRDDDACCEVYYDDVWGGTT